MQTKVRAKEKEQEEEEEGKESSRGRRAQSCLGGFLERASVSSVHGINDIEGAVEQTTFGKRIRGAENEGRRRKV